MVEPVFEASDFSVIQGTPKQYAHVSEGSGKEVYIHFCDTCGTKLFLTFERFEDSIGVYGGTFDDPNALDIAPENSKHIFLGVAQKGTIIPPHVDAFDEHATENDGTPIAATVYKQPHCVGGN